MRVIGGFHRSRKLQEVPSKSTRETKDRVKESIFNSLQFDLPEANVLDLFCGSGSLGIEALSRSASHCDFVDQSPLAIDVTRANLTSLNVSDMATVTQQDALSYISSCNQVYDIILLDPPYDLDIVSDIIEVIGSRALLAPTGKVVALSAKNHDIKRHHSNIKEYKTRNSGITKITYLKWGESQ